MIKKIIDKLIIEEYEGKYLIFSIISGILIGLSFQKFNIFIFVWIAFIPLIHCIYENNFKKIILYSFITGFVFNTIYLYWMLSFLLFHTDSILSSFFIALLTWLYFSIYFCVWATIFYFFKKKIDNKILLTILIASLWTILDFVKTYIMTGLSWNLLAYTQTSFLYLIQICDVFGVYFISFIIIFVNMLIYFFIREKKKIYLIIPFITIMILCGYGYFRVNSLDIETDKKISVGVVQPNIEQKKKWDIRYKEEILSSISKNVKETFKGKILDLIVYPETILPGYLKKDFALESFVRDVSCVGKINLFGGIDILEFSTEKLNSVFVISQQGKILDQYNKNYLILFGEYLPLNSFFDFLFAKLITELNTTGKMVKDKSIKIIKLEHLNLGINICSENYYSNLSRDFSLLGAEMFTTHVNDAWFDGTSAINQHFIVNVFRAIENRKYLVVSANTGISGVIAPTGKILRQTNNKEQTCFEEIIYANNYITVYDKIGDLFVYLCMVLVGVFFII